MCVDRRRLRALVVVACVAAAAVTVQRRGAAQPGEGGEIVATARQVAREVSRARGLRFKRPLCHRLANRREMMALVKTRVRAQYSPDDLRREGQLLALLGVLDDAAGYEAGVYRMVEGSISGTYDPAGDCLYLPRWLGPEEQVDALYHETAHALQDQHFDLSRVLARWPGDSDRLAAASAVAEGDATAVTMIATSPEGASGMASGAWARALRSALLEPAPGLAGGALGAHVRRSLAFAYADGLELVRGAHARSGWRGVDALLREPPATTEAVLHPERAGESEVVPLARPAALPESCVAAHEDTVGEALLRDVLARRLPDAEAAAAVAGWGGDRALVLDSCPRPGQASLVLATRWDAAGPGQAPAAGRFERGLVRALGVRHGRSPAAGAAGATFDLGRGRCALVARRGDAVIYLEGVACAVAEAVTVEVLSGLGDRRARR
jgi:hypothetical protein